MFTTKPEYIAWRSQWRADYAALSLQIREAKADRKGPDPQLRACAQIQCWRLRKQATALLDKRKESKLLAQQQYLAAKAQAAAA